MALQYMDAGDLINQSCFVKEPSYEIISKIKSSKFNKIILAGPRYSGKSVTLNEYVKSNIKTGNELIYVGLDFYNNINFYSKEELICYFELIMSNYIYSYIEDNYKKIYDEKFAGDHLFELIQLRNLREYINDKWFYPEKTINRLAATGEITKDIISKVKETLGIQSLSVVFDHFDEMGGSSKFAQNLLSQYFSIFDKAIITSIDQDVYQNNDRQTDLKTKGYDVINVDYGKNIDSAKEIITAGINNYNAVRDKGNKHPSFENTINEETYNYLIEKANGNFDVLFSTITNFYLYQGFSSYTDCNENAKKGLEKALQVEKCLSKRKLNTKLYL